MLFFLTGALSSMNLEMFAETPIAEAPILMPNFQHLSISNQIEVLSQHNLFHGKESLLGCTKLHFQTNDLNSEKKPFS